MPSEKDSPVVRKGFIYLLPVIVAGIALNLLFNSEARNLVGLKAGKTFSLKNIFCGWNKKLSVQPADAVKPLTFSPEEIRVFTESFTKSDVKVLVMPPDLKTGEEERKRREDENKEKEQKLKEEEERKKAEEAERTWQIEEEERRKSTPWPVTIQGTFVDHKGRWTAIIAGKYCQPGKEIVSDQTNRCAYTILSVGRNCVWLHAYRSDKPRPPDLPDVEWPDVSMIESVHEGLISRSYVPVRVRLANGKTAKKDEKLVFETMNMFFTVKELWGSGVVFEAAKADKSAKIACMLVRH